MIFSRDYRRPFWRGLIHAFAVIVYCLFSALLLSSMEPLFGSDFGDLIRGTFILFFLVLSVAVCAYLIFYEPLKKILHNNFKAGTVMLISTLGWLFIFLIIFIMGLVLTAPVY